MNKACEGCCHNNEGTNLECGIYGIPPLFFMKVGECPINPKEVVVKPTTTRVGQAKGKRGKKNRG